MTSLFEAPSRAKTPTKLPRLVVKVGSHIVLDPDYVEALLGDAKGHGSEFSVAPPAQQRATGANLFQQPGADELVDLARNRHVTAAP